MSRIKELRKEKKLSQQELANLLYVNQTAVSQWERGVTTPNPQLLIKLSEVFGVSVDYILGNESTTAHRVNPETLQIAKRIIERRTELNITREELAEKIGVSKSTMQRYESGAVQHIPFEKLEKIADALNTTVATLSGYEEEEKKADVLADIFSAIFDDEDIRTVITALVNIKRNDPDNFRNIATLIMGLSK